MKKFVGILGLLSLIFGIADLVHGQHNGDTHRLYIHIVEFIFFFAFLCLLQIWAFRAMTSKWNINRWLIVILSSIVTGILGLILFALSGGSFHGDGGPIATTFLVMSLIGDLGLPIGVVGFLVNAIIRKNAGFPVLAR
jgi:hypothetical protein